MKQSLDRSLEDGGKETGSGSVETQQLHYHLGELRTTVRRAHAMRVDFEALIQEAQSNLAAAQALMLEINLLALRLEISPLPSVKSWSAQVRRKSRTKISILREEALTPVK